MKISKRNLSRLIESLIRGSELEKSLEEKAFEEIDFLKQQGVASLLDNVLMSINPNLNLANILVSIRDGKEILLEKEEVAMLDSEILSLSELIKPLLEKDEEHITRYIKDITPVMEDSYGSMAKTWYKDGKEHREGDKPAKITYSEDGSIFEEFWFKNGMSHREGDKPSYVHYRKDGSIQREVWEKDGKWYREGDKPAEIWYREDGSIYKKYWYKDGERHREGDKPAGIVYIKANLIGSEHWYKDGDLHREGDKPARVWYYEDGSIKKAHWYKDGYAHREGDNPAMASYRENGSIWQAYWFKDGRIVRTKKGRPPRWLTEPYKFS